MKIQNYLKLINLRKVDVLFEWLPKLNKLFDIKILKFIYKRIKHNVKIHTFIVIYIYIYI